MIRLFLLLGLLNVSIVFAQFTEVQHGFLLNGTPSGTTSGLSWYDYNRDGWDDLTVGQGSAEILLYRNMQGTLQLVYAFPNTTQVKSFQWVDYDNDGDGFSNWNVSYIGCFAQPGYVAYVPGSQSDCDDNNFIYQDLDGDGFGSDELVACGGVYNTDDCDDNVLFYQDFDQDGFGSNNLVGCGGSLLNTDCDDFNSASPTNANTWYFDYDGDGFGWADDVFVTCDFPSGYVLNSDDCYPYALTYGDEDGDYYGNGVLAACGVFIESDCDDSNPAINEERYYLEDADNDGFGSFVNYYLGCPSEGYILYKSIWQSTEPTTSPLDCSFGNVSHVLRSASVSIIDG